MGCGIGLTEAPGGEPHGLRLPTDSAVVFGNCLIILLPNPRDTVTAIANRRLVR